MISRDQSKIGQFQIYGYTDRIGVDAYNAKIGQPNVPKNVKAYLESKTKASKYEIFGVGEKRNLVRQQTQPIGRQLSRNGFKIYVSHS